MRWARAMAAGSSSRRGAGRPAVARPEGGERVLAEGDDRHAAGLEHLERLRQVEDRLGAGGDHGDRGLGEFLEVGGDVEGRLGAAVDAADAAGGEDLDAGEARADHRGGDGGRAGPALGQRHGEVGAESLRTPSARGERVELVGLEADPDQPPSSTAIVAGTAPSARTAASTARAVSRFAGTACRG